VKDEPNYGFTRALVPSRPTTSVPEPLTAQRELGLLSLLKAPALVRGDVLRTFGDDEEFAVKAAIKWAWLHRRVRNMTQASAADHVGIKPPHFANILNGKKYLPPHKLNAFEWIVGNRALSLTIERFRVIREEQSALQLAREIVAARR
jgi:hypothetical protein